MGLTASHGGVNTYWPSRTRSSKRCEISWPRPAGVPSSVLGTCLPEAHLVPDYMHDSISDTSSLQSTSFRRISVKFERGPLTHRFWKGSWLSSSQSLLSW